MTEEKKDYQLINVVQTRMTKEKGKSVPLILIIERIAGKKRVRRVENPLIDIYFLNEPGRDWIAGKRKPRYIPKSLVDCYSVPVDDIDDEVVALISEFDSKADRANRYIDFYNAQQEKPGKKDLQALHKHPFVFGSDPHPSDFFISKWHDEHAEVFDSTAKLQTAFFDIEVDIVDHIGFPDEHEAPCEVNMISYVFGDKAYLFCLENDSDSFRDFKENRVNEFMKEMYHLYGPPAVERKELPIPLFKDLEVIFYTEELDLIKAFFELLHTEQPDTLSA